MLFMYRSLHFVLVLYRSESLNEMFRNMSIFTFWFWQDLYNMEEEKKMVVGEAENKQETSRFDYFYDGGFEKEIDEFLHEMLKRLDHGLRPKKNINYKQLSGVRSKCRSRKKGLAAVTGVGNTSFSAQWRWLGFNAKAWKYCLYYVLSSWQCSK